MEEVQTNAILDDREVRCSSAADSSAASSLDFPTLLVVGDLIYDITAVLGPDQRNYEGITTHAKMDSIVQSEGGAGLVLAGLRELGHDPKSCLIASGDTKLRIYREEKLLNRYDIKYNGSYVYPTNYLYSVPETLVLVDYGKGGIPDWYVDRIRSTRPQQLFVHAKTNPAKYYDLEPIFFTNSREWPLNSRYPGMVVQTLGEHGARLMLDGQEIFRTKSKVKDYKTVIGAGDYVMAGFIDAVLNGSSYQEALVWSQTVVADAMKSPYICTIEPGTISWSWYYGNK